MTLHIYENLEQGSDDWLQARCGMLTASTIGKLITPTLKVADNDTSRGLTLTLAAERITGHVEYVHPSFDMQRGTLDEPIAKDIYSEQYAPVQTIGFAVRSIADMKLGASPDGLIGDDGGIEIKSRGSKTQLKTFLADEVPAENIAQIQACMYALDREWWDYVSYAGGWPLYVKRVYRDPDWQTAIVQALETFEENIDNIIDAYRVKADGAPVAPRVDHFAEMSI